MPHIDLPEGIPGIRSAFAFRPETAEPLCALAEVLLRGDNSLSRGDRSVLALQRHHHVIRDGAAFKQQAADQRRFPIIDRATGKDAKQRIGHQK